MIDKENERYVLYFYQEIVHWILPENLTKCHEKRFSKKAAFQSKTSSIYAYYQEIFLKNQLIHHLRHLTEKGKTSNQITLHTCQVQVMYTLSRYSQKPTHFITWSIDLFDLMRFYSIHPNEDGEHQTTLIIHMPIFHRTSINYYLHSEDRIMTTFPSKLHM